MNYTMRIYTPEQLTAQLDDEVLSFQEQLVAKSKEKEIIKQCPEDSLRRFHNYESIQKWSREVGTVVLGFHTQSNDVAGIVFFREKEHPLATPQTTFAIRIYEGFSGRGLAKKYMDASHQWAFRQMEETSAMAPWMSGTRGIWLSVKPDNIRALSAYNSFGYKTCGVDTIKNRVIMEYHGVNE